MPVWRDPLDELIAALERVTPVGTASEPAFEMPPMEDYSVAVQAILSRDPSRASAPGAGPCGQARRGVSPAARPRMAVEGPSSADPVAARFTGKNREPAHWLVPYEPASSRATEAQVDRPRVLQFAARSRNVLSGTSGTRVRTSVGCVPPSCRYVPYVRVRRRRAHLWSLLSRPRRYVYVVYTVDRIRLWTATKAT